MKGKEIEIVMEGKVSEEDISISWVEEMEELRIYNKNILLNEFDKELKEKNLEVEFRILNRITNTNKHVEKMYQDKDEKFYKKNRYEFLIPFYHSMPKCECNLTKKKGFSNFFDDDEKVEKVKKVKKEEEKKKGIDSQRSTEELDPLFLQSVKQPKNNFYINANFILHPVLKNTPSQYIATQYPVESSLHDLWHMVYENEIEFIVMLNDTKENKINVRDKYFPKIGDILKLDNFEIRNLGQISEDFASFQKLILIEKNDNKKKILKHFHIKNWEDKNVIVDNEFDDFLHFLKILHKNIDNQSLNKKNKKPPLLVHCKAGIGRTGTFLSTLFIYDYFVELKKKYGKDLIKDQETINKDKIGISIFSIIRKMREERWGMVQLPKQYFFIHNFTNYMLKNFELI